MGTFTVPIQIGNQATSEFRQMDALVDTGATYTLLPGQMLAELGIQAVDQRAFQLADESIVNYQVGEARLRLRGD
jgi:predicted aspartyl protease